MHCRTYGQCGERKPQFHNDDDDNDDDVQDDKDVDEYEQQHYDAMAVSRQHWLSVNVLFYTFVFVCCSYRSCPSII